MAYREELHDNTHWGEVVELIQTAFWEGHLAEECTWQIVLIIPKGHGDFSGIGLVKVMCKMVTGIMNLRIILVISFHYTLQGFHAGRGTGDGGHIP